MRRLLPAAGFTVALVFCGYAIWKGSRDLPALALDQGRFWLWTGAALLLYLLSQAVAAQAWSGTLAVFSVRLPRGRAESQLLVSQIGKYIPGNIAHLIGRLALARADGVPAGVVGFALLAEVGLVLSAGGLLLACLLVTVPDLVRPLLPETGADLRRPLSLVLGLAVLLAILLGVGVLQKRARGQAVLPRLAPRQALWPFTLHLGNSLILGLSLACVIRALDPATGTGLILPVAVFVAAWTLGFLTPGAPGGIGIREGLIVLGLGLSIGDGPALAAALLHRGLAVGGDLIAFALGCVLRHRTAAGPGQ